MPTDSIADALELLDFSAAVSASHERPAFAGYSSTLLALARFLIRLCCVFEWAVYAQQPAPLTHLILWERSCCQVFVAEWWMVVRVWAKHGPTDCLALGLGG